MDCDGPKHSLVRDLDGQFVGTHPSEGSVIPFAELRYNIFQTESLTLCYSIQSTGLLTIAIAFPQLGWPV